MNYTTATKSGRAFNGAHRDAGSIIHLVPPIPSNGCGDWFDKALCGTQPGFRGNGWTESDKQVTCLKCLKKIQKFEGKNGKDKSWQWGGTITAINKEKAFIKVGGELGETYPVLIQNLIITN